MSDHSKKLSHGCLSLSHRPPVSRLTPPPLGGETGLRLRREIDRRLTRHRNGDVILHVTPPDVELIRRRVAPCREQQEINTLAGTNNRIVGQAARDAAYLFGVHSDVLSDSGPRIAQDVARI